MEQGPVIIFDGVCNLCNGFVQYIIRKDPYGNFKFSALQSAFGQSIAARNHSNDIDADSVLLWENGKLYNRSTAILRIAKKLGGFYRLLYGFILVPVFIRDGIYRWIAGNRYKWFGKMDQCMIPSPGLSKRFLN